jgi:hypothetical protein
MPLWITVIFVVPLVSIATLAVAYVIDRACNH